MSLDQKIRQKEEERRQKEIEAEQILKEAEVINSLVYNTLLTGENYKKTYASKTVRPVYF